MQDSNKERYRTFCKEELNLPIFMQDWWLDVVCKGGTWNVCLALDNEARVRGVLPYYLSNFWGFKVIRQPPLSPHVGVWLKYPSQNLKLTKKYAFEIQTCKSLIEQLPKVAYYAQTQPVQLQNWLPFYWKGFEQTTLYTHELSDLKDLDTVWKGLNSGTRGRIRKAKREGYTIIESSDVHRFLKIHKTMYERQKIKQPFSDRFFSKLYSEVKTRDKGKIYLAKNKAGEIVGGKFLIWDGLRMYCLMYTANDEGRKNGMIQLLLWNGINEAAKKGLIFDFEGGMWERIEKIFAAFGVKKRSYHWLKQKNNLLFRIALSFRKLDQ